MKRTILRRTEITIEALEITTIRRTPRADVPDTTGEDHRARLVENLAPELSLTRMERAKQLLRRKTK